MGRLMKFIWCAAGKWWWGGRGGGSHLGLEGAVERGEEVGAGGERQHPLLHHGALCVLVLEEDVLLQHLDGEEALVASFLGQQHLQSGGEEGGGAVNMPAIKKNRRPVGARKSGRKFSLTLISKLRSQLFHALVPPPLFFFLLSFFFFFIFFRSLCYERPGA